MANDKSEEFHNQVVRSRQEFVRNFDGDDKQTLPSERRFFCNQCSGDTLHNCKVNYFRPHLVGEDKFIGGYLYFEGHRLWQCAGCSACLLQRYTAEDDWSGDESEIRDEIFPERNKFHTHYKGFRKLPEKLENIYRETLHAFNQNLPILCAVGIRALLEGICEDQSIEGRNLKIQINGLKDILPSHIVDSLHAFRFIGNQAVHELNAPNPLDLRLAIEICEDLLNFLYELEYKVSELHDSVNEASET